MKYIVEESAEKFEFWGGAKNVANRINERSDSSELWDTFETFIDEMKTEGKKYPTCTEVNDILWFEYETVFGFDVFDKECDVEYERDDDE